MCMPSRLRRGMQHAMNTFTTQAVRTVLLMKFRNPVDYAEATCYEYIHNTGSTYSTSNEIPRRF